jgi:uncharacterized membrane protein
VPRLLLLPASFAGFVISLYLTLMHFRGAIPACFIVQGCETVQTSRYSAIGGIPLAFLGTGFFTVTFYMSIGLIVSPGVLLVRAYKLLTLLGAVSVIPLFLIQAIVLSAYCSYCLATEIVMLAMWIGSYTQKSTGTAEATSEDRSLEV